MSKERIKLLESEVLKHKRLYYQGKKEIEDEKYDLLENELKKLDPKNPLLSMIGSDFFSGEKIKHNKKMLSLDKKYEVSELISWRDNQELIGMFKVDGSSCSLIFQEGKFKLAKTRGDGEFGENITPSCMYVPSIKKIVEDKEEIEIRGEVYCKKSRFIELCEEMERRNLPIPKSPRNVVAGILGRKDHIDLAQFLDFLAFDYIIEKNFKYELDKIELLKKNGFELPFVKVIENEQELKNFLNETVDFINNGDFLIDGAVFVINNVENQLELGYTGHHPKYKMAFKFQSEGTKTILNNIEWQISRFGVYTPVGIVEPVYLDGATINKVTLHNLKTVKLFNLKKGDEIKIVRSGEVIPKFLEVIKPSNNELEVPEKCYFCENKLIEEEVRLICDNKDCTGRHGGYILNFIKKIGIEDLSEKRLEPMMDQGMIEYIPDIYRLTKEQLLTLPKTKEKLANKILENIEKSKKVNIIKFLSSLNFVGGAKKNTELLLEEGYDSFDKIFELTEEDLLSIKGFAKKKASDFINSLNENKELINELLELGFKVEFPKKEGNSLSGLIFCITGDVNIASNRKALETLIKNYGGKTSSSVSSKTNYLICNEKSNSSKYKKAEELGIQILTEEDFEEMFMKIDS